MAEDMRSEYERWRDALNGKKPPNPWPLIVGFGFLAGLAIGFVWAAQRGLV